MAKLRRLGRGLAAAGESLGGIITRDETRKREERARQAAIQMAQLEHVLLQARQQQQERSALQRQILAAPEQAERLQAQGQRPFGLDPSQYGRTTPERIRPIAEDIEKATTPEGVGSAPSILGRAGREGLDTSAMTIPNPMTGAAMGQAATRPPIQELMRQRQEKEASTRAALEQKAKATPHIIPGTSQTGFETPGGETMFTELSPSAKGRASTEEALAGELSPAYGVAKAEAENLVARLTRGEATRTAEAVSGAQARGRLGEELSTSNIAKRVMEANAKAQGEQAASGAGGAGAITTEGERRAASHFVTLLNAHAKSLEFEKQGASIAPLIIQGSTSPTFTGTLGQGYHPLTRQYVQSAMNYINTYTYILSGAATRAEERPNYLSTLFRLSGESPELARQKQQARAVFNAASQITVGRSGREAGRTIGRAVAQGLMTAEQMATFKYRPEILQGILDELDIPPELLARMK